MMVDLQDRFFLDASAYINIPEADLLLTHQIYMKETNKRQLLLQILYEKLDFTFS